MADKLMETCIVCQIIENKIPSKKVYEDGMVLAVLDINGANPGHCFVMPKLHYPIIEQVPDAVIARLFQVSNKISSAIFESLGAHGTNIFVANGVPAGQTVAHVTVNVIPRKEGDGINLQWQPKQLNEEEISTIELRLKEQTKNIGHFEKEVERAKAEPVERGSALARSPNAQSLYDDYNDDEEEYFTRQMRKIP